MNKRKYDLAVSYASEQRPYVERFVKRLQSLNLFVYYDRNEQRQMVGKILDQELHKIYIQTSKHCVIFLSDAYIKKPVTRYESEIILSERLYKANFMYIFEFNHVTLPGLNRNFVYSSVEEFPEPEKYADFMYEVIQNKRPENQCDESLYKALSEQMHDTLKHISKQYGLAFTMNQQAEQTLLQLQSEHSILVQLKIGNLPGKQGVFIWIHRGRRTFDKHAYQGYVQWLPKDCCYRLENHGLLSDLVPELTFSSMDGLVTQLEGEIQRLIGG